MTRSAKQRLTSCSRRGLVAAVAALCGAPAGAFAETITVNDGGDVTAANDGNCTLREAITAANSNTASGPAADECDAGEDGPAERDVIDFSLGAGFHVISLVAAELPALTDQVELDGTNGTAGARVAIDGSGTGANAEGLFLTTGSEGSSVHDVAVHSFSSDGVNLFSGENVIEDVITGTDLAGTASTLGNGGHGVDVLGDDNSLDQVLASANDLYGVNVSFQADRTTITGSRIGTTKDGTGDLGNAQSGIQAGATTLEAADDTVIGGTAGLTPGGACTGDCNLISGNGLDGIQLSAASFPITGAEIRGNHIGTDLAGTGDVGNTRNGVLIAGDVQGAVVRDNLVSGNVATGLSVGATSTAGATVGPSDTRIAGNRVGVDTTGASALVNGDRGMSVTSDVTSGFDPVTGTVIGGTAGLTPGGSCTGDCNVISGSVTFGLSLFGNVDGTQVLGNHIGTDLAGTAAVSNQQSGVSVADVEGVQVGAPGAGNVVSGNAGNGIQVSQAPAANDVRANLIGTGSDGTTPLGNGGSGVSLLSDSHGTLIGGTGPGEANLIANNGEAGVEVAGGATAATENTVLGNSIVSNDGLGIDLGAVLGAADGVTPNDGPGDPDTGGNGLQNSPELAAAVAATATTVAGKLESAADTTFRIEVLSNTAEDPSGYGEGEAPLGSFDLTTDAAGEALFAETVPGLAGSGEYVSATATELDAQGDPLSTSEFAANVTEGCDLTGTPGDDPALTGTGADEVICGLAGDDVIDGGGGEDVIVGGDGVDLVDYSDEADSIEADLEAGTVTGPGAGLDFVAGIEEVEGSNFADVLTGDAGKNLLKGRGGADTLTGRDGKDVLDGGDNKDDLKGQGGTDEIKARDGKDELKGGDGKEDDLKAGDGADSLNGGDGGKDSCDGDGGSDETPAPGCEIVKSIP